MASEEQLQLSTQIKCIHKNLRNRTKIAGPINAWIEHINNKDELHSYSYAMQKLATQYWDANIKENQKNQQNRIEWSVQFCLQYFRDSKIRNNNRERETRIYDLMINSIEWEKPNLADIDLNQKIRLLDVGSCYNPFKQYSDFDVTAIDISPASSDVQNCDFLSVTVNTNKDNIQQDEYSFTVMTYDVVVFSLLLEYLPTSQQRLNCCRKAYDVLDVEGILIIITPDSKHGGKNAKLMKNWRYTLAQMGFSRIKYEKLDHITCMVFRKALFKETTHRWAAIHKEEYMTEELSIPQDFNEFEEKCHASE